MNENTDNLARWERLWRRWIYRLALAFALAQLVLILASWLVAAAMPDMAVRSLLSSAGIRWFFSNFADKVATPWLTWLIVMAIALGSIEYSGLWQAVVTIVRGHVMTSPHSALCLRLSMALLVVEVMVMVLLTATAAPVLLVLRVSSSQHFLGQSGARAASWALRWRCLMAC
jgi:aminobenzoyl-glutamate transport protein